MSKLGRRQTIKLGAVAALVGPSVMFSRRADAKPPRQRTAVGLGAYNFKVEIEGINGALPAVQAVDLGHIKWNDKGVPTFGLLELSLASKLTELEAKFEDGVKVAAHKVSVSLYGRGGKTPTITYHVHDATPLRLVIHQGKHGFAWKMGDLSVDGYKDTPGKHAPLPKEHYNFELDHVKMAAASVSRFSLDAKKDEVKVLQFDPPSAKWSEQSPLEVKLSTKKAALSSSPPLATVKGETQATSLSFTKIEAQAIEKHDQVAVTTFVTPGTPPPSAIFVKTLTGGGTTASAWGGYIKIDGVDGESAKMVDKSTPVLMIKMDSPPTSANKASPKLMLSVAAQGEPQKGNEPGMLKMSLRGIDLPKLEKGSKALVTETLYFDVDKG